MKHALLLAACAAATGLAGVSAPAQAQTSDRYLGDIFMVGFNFCPQGSSEANGALLAIVQNQALYSLLGTTYGGDGRSSFALPDLRGRVPVSYGAGQGGLPDYPLGAAVGSETTTMGAQGLPSHSHPVYGTSHEHTEETPLNNTLATFDDGQTPYSPSPVDTPMSPLVVTSAGGGQPFNNMAPSLTIRYCIVTTQGLYPPRP
ncbi:phage tail protein [Hyphobacterium marinum]|uniref:Tail fiber protein n=1 Tax=Hyphobacterium marinum TaxID=3116574 RepID=A0ABU7LYE1_9PROT|nr:tail fiber protein [Hyphobacterium sp. Y6023]MEE2566572.1 tail fiber protein [Hyphobacterium sp. Y6023]